MIFQEFRSTFQGYPVFSAKEIGLIFPGFDRKNLVNWQQKNYVQKIRNAWYRLTESPLDTETLFFISNHIYQPSYVSLESALSYYGFIPEGAFKTTAVSTLKTQQFQTPIGDFGYQNIKPSLYFGYRIHAVGKHFFKVAEPEKAVLDFIYLHPELDSVSHFEGLRWNAAEMKRTLASTTLRQFLDIIGSPTLEKRMKTCQKFIENQ